MLHRCPLRGDAGTIGLRARAPRSRTPPRGLRDSGASTRHTSRSMRSWRQLCGLVLVMSLTHGARGVQAQAIEPPAPPPQVRAEPGTRQGAHAWLEPGWLAGSIGLVPGFVLHGAGAFAIG